MPPDDPISHPAHYTRGRIEVIDFIEDQGFGFHIGNAIKYLSRAGVKDPTKEIQDFRKAVWYILRHVELIEAQAATRDAQRPDPFLYRPPNCT